MLKRFFFPSHTLLLFAMAIFLIFPSALIYAQDDSYDDEYYEEEVIASYEVSGLKLVGDPEPKHLQLWNSFATLIPAESIDGVITFFEVFADNSSVGYVYGDDDDIEKYVLGLNPIDLDNPAELQHTVIHLYAYILMLNFEQIDMGVYDKCPTYELDEGCIEDDSYIFAFYETFYEDGRNRDEDAFVTDYASSDITADMAETFTFFVLYDRPDGETVAEEKILFFYNYEELIDLRADIRGNMDQS